MYINKPPKIIFWDLDEAMSFLLPLMIFGLLGKFVLGTFLGFSMFYGLKLIKTRVGISTLAHSLYWYFPTPRSRFRIYIPSYKREYIG